MLTLLAVLALSSGAFAQICDAENKDKVWLLSIEHNWGAFSYIDAAGYFKGFSYDLAKKVCEAAGVKCQYLFDTPINCVDDKPGQHAVLGLGLQAEYYDACISWQVTVERIHFGKFSKTYAIPVDSLLFYKAGASFDRSDYSSKTIAFLQGWTGNEKCLARNLVGTAGIPLETANIKYYIDAEHIKNAIVSGEVDAALVLENGLMPYVDSGELDYDEASRLKCTLGGAGVLTRKDNTFTDIWNRGFDVILRNGVFKEVCATAAAVHGGKGDIECVTSYDWSI